MTAASFAIGAAEQFNGDFYATIATVIPVLIALLFFEGRVHEKFVEREYAAISGSIGIVLLVVAETNALHVLYHRESPERVQLALIVVAIFWGLTTLVIGAVYERVYEYAPEYEFAATIALPLIGMATGVVGLVAGASLIVALSIVVLTLSFLTIPLFALSRFRSRRAKQVGRSGK